MAYEPLHHKYRPQRFADLVGQDAIAQTLTNAILSQRIAPAYIFTGPRGTGKTSSARILAKSLNCLSHQNPTPTPCGTCDVCVGITKGSTLDMIEIDAASNTGVDNIRELIERAQFAPVQCRYKVYVIDEVHMLSASAFNALLKTLEEPPKQVVFILATTDPQRVLATIISRCQRFDFRRIPLEAMVRHLQKIAREEKIEITTEAIQIIAQISLGGLRDAESLLDQLSLLEGEITVERVWDLVGVVPERDLMALLKAIASDNSTEVLQCSRQIMDRGREPIILLQNLAGFYRDLLIAKASPINSNLVALTKPTWEELCQFSQYWDLNQILVAQKHLQISEAQIKNTTQPRLWLEVTLLGLLPSALVKVQQLPQKQITKQTSQNILVQSSPKTSTQPESKPPVSQEKEKISEVKKTSITKENDETSVSKAVDINTEESDLEQTWQRILDKIKKISTQQLLRQFGKLVSIDHQSACVTLSSPKWKKKVTTKIPQIEDACEKVFNKRIKVRIELEQTNQNHPITRNNDPNSSNRESQKTKHEEQQEIPNSDDEDVEDTGGNVLLPSLPKHIDSKPEKKAPPEISPPQTQYDDVEKQPVAIAAHRVANFFQGEIIDIELLRSANQSLLPAPSESSKSINVQIDDSENSNLEREETEQTKDLQFDPNLDF